jgi:hypothetical protein
MRTAGRECLLCEVVGLRQRETGGRIRVRDVKMDVIDHPVREDEHIVGDRTYIAEVEVAELVGRDCKIKWRSAFDVLGPVGPRCRASR